LVEHTLPELLKQRIFALCLGYEDLNDHDRLRHDPLLAVLVGKKDPTGCQRARARDRGKALAGKSTLNRLELTPVRANAASRYKKIVAHLDAIGSRGVGVGRTGIGSRGVGVGRTGSEIDATRLGGRFADGGMARRPIVIEHS
jgi:hypothetical protein